jgi:hypothetical protein
MHDECTLQPPSTVVVGPKISVFVSHDMSEHDRYHFESSPSGSTNFGTTTSARMRVHIFLSISG